MNRIKPLSQLISELLLFFEAQGHITASAIARVTGVNQSQVHRNLYGQPKRFTKTHLRLCIYAKIDTQIEAHDPRTCSVLMNALSSVWDGSDDHARRLAALLLAHSRASVSK
jgi:predicted XRE-type DNA-binding protein